MNLPRSLAKAAVSLALLAGFFPESARAGSPCTTYGRASLALCALTGPSSLALPVLAWPGGNPGIPRVITWADTTGASGIAWGTTSQIAAANASWTYDGTNLVGNVPTGSGFALRVNNVNQFTVSVANVSVTPQMNHTAKSTWGSASAPASTDAGIGYDGTNLIINAPITKGIILSDVGLTALKVDPNNGIEIGAGAFQQLMADPPGSALLITGGSNFRNQLNINDAAGSVYGMQVQLGTTSNPGLSILGQNAAASSTLFRVVANTSAPIFAIGDATLLANAGTITVDGTGSYRRTTTGNMDIGPTSANSTLDLYAGSAGGARTIYASVNNAGVQTDGLKVLTGAGNLTVVDSAGNNLATLVDLGTTGALKISGNQIQTQADGNTFTISDGTNTLFSLADSGTTGAVSTGSVTTTGSVSALNLQASGDLKLADAHGVIDTVNGNVHYLIHTIGNSAPDELRGLTNDGASGVAMRISAAQDFVTAGSKIASFGDNAATAYAEQAYVGFDGTVGTNTIRAFTAAGNVTVVDSAANNLATFVDLGTTGALKISGNEWRSNADGNSLTITDGTNTLVTVADGGTVGNLSTTGTIKPTSAATGAAVLTNFLKQTYVIDFAAFTAGIDQVSAQAMTGVAFGDACDVGTATDQTAAIGQLTVMVTSAGNIKIIASPVSTTSTANPASDTYTVSCLR